MRRLARAVLAAVGLAATSLVATSGAADAAGRTLYSASWSGRFAYAIQGKIAHVPGNAHSGVVDQPQADGDNATLLDWNCPKGVAPPSPFADPAASSCTLLRSLTVYEGSLSAYPDPTYGLGSIHEAGTHTDVVDNFTGEYLSLTVSSNYTEYGSGPISTVTYSPVNGYQEVDRTRAVTRVTGRYGWINFNDPRVKISGGQLTGYFTFQVSG